LSTVIKRANVEKIIAIGTYNSIVKSTVGQIDEVAASFIDSIVQETQQPREWVRQASPQTDESTRIALLLDSTVQYLPSNGHLVREELGLEGAHGRLESCNRTHLESVVFSCY